jgi:preprotein translocase subunit SecA
MRQQGKKGQAWAKARAKLKIQFERMGITACEICSSTFALSFAHRLKRRFITTEDELMTVALLCQKHHEEIEHSGHENMFDRITKIIEQRAVQI